MKSFKCKFCGKVNEYYGNRKPHFCLKKLGESNSACKKAWARLHYQKKETIKSTKKAPKEEETRPKSPAVRALARLKMREAMKRIIKEEARLGKDYVEIDVNEL